MSQNYTPTEWVDNRTVGTASVMNNMEKGIEDAHNRIDEVDSQIKDIETRIDNIGGSEGNIQPITQVEPGESDMPKVFFYGSALPTTKNNVNLTMDYVSNTTKFSSFVKLKCQGTSSMNYAKKNFTVAMYSDEARETKLKKDFKGWGAQSKFCLKANYVDTTHTRNLSGARIAYDMVQSRPDSPFKQQLLQCPRNGAVDGFPIKLYFNGEFYGIYTWNIPKDGWMFNMDKSNSNHVVLCAERNTDGNSSLINSCQFRKLWDGGGDWSYEFGTPSDTVKNSLNRCINFVMTATDKEFHDNIGEYFDLYSLLDYYCFSYLTCHIDGLAKNMLMATYDGVIWGACLYDMDSIYGVNWNGNSYVATNYQCPEQYLEQFSLLWQRIERCFGAELYARYLELRQGALSLSNIIKHVEEIYDVIPDRVFADEKAKWTNLPQVSANTMTRFRNYMRDRAVYVDAQMEEIGTKIDCTGITLNQTSVDLTADNTTVTLVATVEPSNTTDAIIWSSNAPSIATVNNGLVTAKANGSAVITATCGSQSATCAVTVSGINGSGGSTEPENILQTIKKTDGYYNDVGVFSQWGNLKTTDYIDMPTTSGRIKHIDETAQLGVTRVSYFDENKTYLGYNRGCGYGIPSQGTGLIELDMDKGAKYFVVSSEDFSVLTYEYSSEDTGINPNLVFQVNNASMNTADNTLTDNIAGISATLTGNPTVSDNQIAFTASDTFSFDISSLNLTSSNRTFRIKFTPTTLDTNTRHVIGIGSHNTNWSYMTTSYITSEKLVLQHGVNNFTNNTVGSSDRGYTNNRLSVPPVAGQEYELVISENADGNVRWFIDGTLVQNGTTTLLNPLYIHNAEGNARFIGSYSLIEIYNGYCETYEDFTSMVNA